MENKYRSQKRNPLASGKTALITPSLENELNRTQKASGLTLWAEGNNCLADFVTIPRDIKLINV